MKPAEIIYNGYVAEHSEIDSQETKEAVDTFLSTVERLLPEETKDQVSEDGMYLLEMGQKQGFEAGFMFALEMLGMKTNRNNNQEVQCNA